MTPRLVALCSPAMGSGKSTVADHLVARHGFTRVAFASPLKRMTEALLLEAGYCADAVAGLVYGDMKNIPLPDLPPFTRRHAEVMLDALGPVPGEIDIGRGSMLDDLDDLVDWGVEHFRDGVTSRRLQQTIGTELGRDQWHPEIWVLIARDTIRAAAADTVVDDMRFPNEFDMIEREGGDTYRVCRPDVRIVGGAHASEGQLDGIAMPEIWNTGSIADLCAAADRAILRA